MSTTAERSIRLASPQGRQIARQIVRQAWPNFIAKMIAIAMMIADTLIAGYYGTQDLAAVAIGSSFYISVIMLLMGTLQSVGPIIAHHVGAKRRADISPALQQGLWLALLLSIPGVLILLNPHYLLRLAQVPENVLGGAADYMAAAAMGLPALLLYRTFYEFNNAVGKPRVLMVFSTIVTVVHIPLALVLAHGVMGLPELGGTGCGVSTAIVNWLALGCCVAYALWDNDYVKYQLFARLHAPSLRAIGQQMRLGLPMGLSTFIDISSFTLIAILVARLGAETVAGHRVVANFTGLIYMLPLSIALATMVLVGHANGAEDPKRSRLTAKLGLSMAASMGLLIGVVLWFVREPLIGLSSQDPAVQGVALGLVVYLCMYQFFDGFQTVASYALRGYKVTLVPMIFHTFCFWGIGLCGGYWLSFYAPWRNGAPSVQGFWEATVLATLAASVLFGVLLKRVSRSAMEPLNPQQDTQVYPRG
jgi:MATE family multidrug resistance protein